MNVWRLITHHEHPTAALQWSEDQNRIAIGWSHIGDLRKFSSPQAIARAIQRTYPKSENAHLGGPSLWHFLHNMKEGDLVILSTGNARKLVMVVRGGYEFVPMTESPLYATYGEEAGYQNQRKADVTTLDPDGLWYLAGGKPAKGDNIRWTLIKCLKSV